MRTFEPQYAIEFLCLFNFHTYQFFSFFIRFSLLFILPSTLTTSFSIPLFRSFSLHPTLPLPFHPTGTHPPSILLTFPALAHSSNPAGRLGWVYPSFSTHYMLFLAYVPKLHPYLLLTPHNLQELLPARRSWHSTSSIQLPFLATVRIMAWPWWHRHFLLPMTRTVNGLERAVLTFRHIKAPVATAITSLFQAWIWARWASLKDFPYARGSFTIKWTLGRASLTLVTVHMSTTFSSLVRARPRPWYWHFIRMWRVHSLWFLPYQSPWACGGISAL